MKLGILKSTTDPLVGLTPQIAQKLIRDGFEIVVEQGAGEKAFYTDEEYQQANVLVTTRQEALIQSEVLVTIAGILPEDLEIISSGTFLIGKFNSREENDELEQLKTSKARVFSLDRIPRSSIAQSMDVLSSLASLSGYKAVITAANRFPGYLAMMVTAAGTIPPAKVLVLGAGVAGLQAIATARRLGAEVEAFDVRSAVKEEVESLGARFIEVAGSTESDSAGGYALEQGDEYIRRQKALIQERVGKADLVITTANIPGKKAPLLIEKAAVKQMKSGSVIVDMASQSGGNCELSVDNQEILIDGVTIVGNSQLYADMPKQASRLYANNLYQFVRFIFNPENGSLKDHDITRQTYIGKQDLIFENENVN